MTRVEDMKSPHVPKTSHPSHFAGFLVRKAPVPESRLRVQSCKTPNQSSKLESCKQNDGTDENKTKFRQSPPLGTFRNWGVPRQVSGSQSWVVPPRSGTMCPLGKLGFSLHPMNSQDLLVSKRRILPYARGEQALCQRNLMPRLWRELASRCICFWTQT